MTSDAQEVEATVIEPCDRLEVERVEVPDVVSNVSAVKAWVDGELARYEAFEVGDEDSYKTAKAQRTSVRKLKSAVDAERKRVKQMYERPLKDFEAQVKTITGPIDSLDAAMKDQISAYERDCELAQRHDLEEYYADLAGILADALPFDRLITLRDPKGAWLKRSNHTKAQSEIGSILGEVKSVLEMIETMPLTDDERIDIKADYLSCLDFTAAGKRIQDKRDARERALELEAEQQRIREVQRRADKDAPHPDQCLEAETVAPTPKTGEVTYAIILPEQQIGGLSSCACDEIIGCFKKYGIHGTKRAEVR
jgi:hypothetical protein